MYFVWLLVTETSPNAILKASSIGKSAGSTLRVFNSLLVRGKKDEESALELQTGVLGQGTLTILSIPPDRT